MLLLPVVLPSSASYPLAVLSLPVVLLWSASKPTAVLLGPVLLKSASSPRTVFWFVKQPSWQTARACGESAKQASTSGMRRKARRGERFIKFLNGRIVVFICAECCKNLANLARRIGSRALRVRCSKAKGCGDGSEPKHRVQRASHMQSLCSARGPLPYTTHRFIVLHNLCRF